MITERIGMPNIRLFTGSYETADIKRRATDLAVCHIRGSDICRIADSYDAADRRRAVHIAVCHISPPNPYRHTAADESADKEIPGYIAIHHIRITHLGTRAVPDQTAYKLRTIDIAVDRNDPDGGLIEFSGFGNSATISYSYVIGSNVSSTSGSAGGLIGYGAGGIIRHSYVADTSITTFRDFVGGLIGFSISATISYSYVVGGSVSGLADVGGLRGLGTSPVNASYWNTTATGREGGGESKTKEELQMPSTTSGVAGSIYEVWGNFWCDPDTGEEVEAATRPDGFLSVWNLGTDEEYPALNCVVGGLEPQGRTPTP